MERDDAEYWTRRAEKETALAKQCSGMEAAAHRTRAARYQDIAHENSRSAHPRSASR